MFLRKKNGQAMTEFVLILPVILFFLLGLVQVSIIAIKAQKLQMAAHYAARLYSKTIIRGIDMGTSMQLFDKKEAILDEIIKTKVNAYLKTDQVTITNTGGNNLSLEWPVTLSFGILGWGFSKDLILKASADMDNEPLSYGGGRGFKEEDIQL